MQAGSTSTAAENGQPPFEIVALAASAGGLPAISQVLASLPLRFPAAIVVVQHLDPRHRSLIADILARRTLLPVKEAEEGDLLTAGAVFVAPPNRHLLVNPDRTLSLSVRAGPFSSSLRRSTFRVRRGQLSGPCHRYGPHRNRQGRGHGSPGHQEDGRQRHCPGCEDL